MRAFTVRRESGGSACRGEDALRFTDPIRVPCADVASIRGENMTVTSPGGAEETYPGQSVLIFDH